MNGGFTPGRHLGYIQDEKTSLYASQFDDDDHCDGDGDDDDVDAMDGDAGGENKEKETAN